MSTEKSEKTNDSKNFLGTINKFLKKSYHQYLGSLDNLFIFIGIILTAFSLIMSFIYGHVIAGIILVVCEVLLIGVYIFKLI